MGPGEGNGACLLLCPHPCYSHRPREVHRLPRLSHEPASAHLEHCIWSGDPRSWPTSSVRGPRPRTLAPVWFLLWVRGCSGIWVFHLRAPRLFPHRTVKVLLCAWGSAVDAGKTTQTGPYSESCAVWGKSRPDQSTQSSYVNMVVWDGYYGEIPVTGVLVSVWEGD